MNTENPQKYEFQFDLLGHEIFKVQIGTTSTTDRWVAITLVTVFCSLTLLGAYGEKFINIVKLITS